MLPRPVRAPAPNGHVVAGERHRIDRLGELNLRGHPMHARVSHAERFRSPCCGDLGERKRDVAQWTTPFAPIFANYANALISVYLDSDPLIRSNLSRNCPLSVGTSSAREDT